MTKPPKKRPDVWREAVPAYVLELCRQLRARQTPAEAILWEALRNRRLGGFKFRRQHPLGRYVADFYCAAAALIIELDGAVHDQPEQREYDEGRQAELVGRRFTVLRFRNEDLDEDFEGALRRIQAHLPDNECSWVRAIARGSRRRRRRPPLPLSTSGEGAGG